jgi:hypothetical protein
MAPLQHPTIVATTNSSLRSSIRRFPGEPGQSDSFAAVAVGALENCRIAGWQNKTLKAGAEVMANFFYSNGDEQIGPVAGHQLKQLAVDGRLVRSGLVWLEGATKKVTADQCPGLVFKNSSEAEPA